MKSSIKYIGVIDHSGKQHAIEFFDGVNVITGRSSTGKSAIIEIFDYCFGKDDNTIPHGVITNNAEIYFCVMSVNDTYIVLARKTNKNIAFIKDEGSLPELNRLNSKYFLDDYFLPLTVFKNSLNNHFNLKVTDTDEDIEARRNRPNNAKSPCASVRHFVSFMLQHQNLIANKHALFYRFDEKAKREQTIDQFKIFIGFVDQNYYLKKQKLAELKRQLTYLKLQQHTLGCTAKKTLHTISNLLTQYEYLTGNSFIVNIEQIQSDPANALDKIRTTNIAVDGDNTDVFSQKYAGYKAEYEKLDYKIHRKSIELGQLEASIEAGKKYNNSLNSIQTIESADLFASECPFCGQRNNNISKETNLLKSAIEWLNNELLKTPTLTNTFLVRESELEQELSILKEKQDEISKLISEQENAVEKIRKNKSRFEQALAVKAKIEMLVKDNIIGDNVALLDKIQECEEKINNIKSFLKNTYDINSKMEMAEESINKNMNEIGKNLDFEQAYRPVNLKFSLDSFDLHFDIHGKSVYLRSVGSGANWLACHISLFTALVKFFCQQGSTCLVPPILFLDQPSQVYFPTSIDIGTEFDAEKLKKNEGKENELDADMESVTNLYQQLVDFCKKTYAETQIMPQIIITDHADNLKLQDCDFDNDLVKNRRWRKEGEGFIKL